jgi:excisionase family DNA binding protein
MSDGKIPMPEHSLPTLLTTEQAAGALQVSTKTILRWISSGDLIAHRLGHQWRISQSDLENFIRMRREA